MTNPTIQATTTYTITVYVMTTWATGNMRGTAGRTFDITEASTILGGMRAIEAAIAQCHGKEMDGYSPTISPNPAELGWPVGE